MENLFIEEARETAAQCWCDIETEKKELDPVLCKAVAKRISFWMDTAAQSQRNTDYYRGLLVKCGEYIGPSSYISDDGSIQEDVLCSKIPEIVKAGISQQKEIIRQLKELIKSLEKRIDSDLSSVGL